jgi:hypothetical protein
MLYWFSAVLYISNGHAVHTIRSTYITVSGTRLSPASQKHWCATCICVLCDQQCVSITDGISANKSQWYGMQLAMGGMNSSKEWWLLEGMSSDQVFLLIL